MAQLRQDYQAFVERHAEIVIVGPEDTQAFARYWQNEKFPFIGLPDPTHKVANLYGQQVKLLRFGRMPALIVVDRQGRIRYNHYADNMSDIPANADILSLLDQLNQQEANTRTSEHPVTTQAPPDNPLTKSESIK